MHDQKMVILTKRQCILVYLVLSLTRCYGFVPFTKSHRRLQRQQWRWQEISPKLVHDQQNPLSSVLGLRHIGIDSFLCRHGPAVSILSASSSSSPQPFSTERMDDHQQTVPGSQKTKSQMRWENWINRLRQYKEKHGDILVIREKSKEHKQLYSWLRRTRKANELQRLNKQQVLQLNEIDTNWARAPREMKVKANWERRVNQLRQYKERHGDILVSRSKGEEYTKLYIWLKRTRKANELQELDKEKVLQLNEIDPNWANKPNYGRTRPGWEHRFNQLREYKEQHGDVFVPGNTTTEHQQLYWWLRYTRKRNDLCKLDKEKVLQLNEIDTNWAMKPLKANWERRVNQLRQYKEQHGDILVSLSKGKEYSKLYIWLRSTRKANELQELDKEKVLQLNEIDPNWANKPNYHIMKWEARINQLREYKEQHGDVFVPHNTTKEHKQLYRWLRYTRKLNELCKLEREKVLQLNEIDPNWVQCPRKVKSSLKSSHV